MTMTLKQAKQLSGVTSARKLDNNTFELQYANGNRAIRLHDTNIVLFYPDGRIKLNTGGWQTPVTKDRMNRFSPFLITQRKGAWYITVNGIEQDFFCGMILKHGEVITEQEETGAGFKSIAAIAMLGDIFTDTRKQSNDWKARMIKAGVGAGIQMPDDWDTLNEDEKQRRLDGVIQIL